MIKYIWLITILLYIIAGCGILPPTNDLEIAKSRIAKAEEVKAEEYAKSEYNEAKTKLGTGESMIVQGKKSSKNKKAQEQILGAQDAASRAFDKAAPVYTEKKINEAEKSLQKAEEIKANVALSDMFSKTKGKIDSAKGLKTEKKYSEAIEYSDTANKEAKNMYNITLEKMTNAEKAINDADNVIKDVKEKSE